MVSQGEGGERRLLQDSTYCGKKNGIQFSLKSLKLSVLTRYGLRVTASKLGCHLNLGNLHSAPCLAIKLPVQLEMSSSALELPSCHVWKITLLRYIAKISGQRPGDGQPLQ